MSVTAPPAPEIRIGVATPPVKQQSRSKSHSKSTIDECYTGNPKDHYGLRWLFDEDNPKHLLIEEKVLQYHQRDLRKTKLYKAATNVFWTPPSRKRVIIARSGLVNRTRKCPSPEPEVRPTETQSAPPERRVESIRDPLEYKSWIAERKALRANLDNMGLNEAYLARKTDKTPLEMSVLRKMIDERTPKPVPPVIPEDPPYDLKLTDDVPRFRRPCPQAIIIIEEFLSKHKMRLVELFKNVDKKKKWKVTREEFTESVKKAGIPVSEMELEDLIVSLDIDMDNCIDYRELVKGMRDWKLQKKRDKQRLISEQGGIPPESLEPPTAQRPESYDLNRARPSLGAISESRQGDDVTGSDWVASHPDPHRLTPPEPDMRPDRYDIESDESNVSLRKMNREMIKARRKQQKTKLPKSDFYDGRSMIKIGNVSIDDHCRPCTMVGEVGRMVDKFRQARLKEYLEVLELCQENDIPLSEKLLAKVLLYRPEKPQSLLKRKLRQPGGTLVSVDDVRPKTKDESSEQIRLFGDDDDDEDIFRGRYRPRKNKPEKMYLSTGKAYISRKVDCWMTFEEYDRLLSKLEDEMYEIGECDKSAFWPGKLAEKLRLCMPPYERHQRPPGVACVFQNVTKTSKRAYPGHDNDLRMWPRTGQYLVEGRLDPYKNKYI